MTTHDKISRKVSGWNPNITVDESITAADWRRMQRPALTLAVLGILVGVVGIALAVMLWTQQWHSREVRVAGLLIFAVAVLISSTTLVHAAGARVDVVRRHRRFFTDSSELVFGVAPVATSPEVTEAPRTLRQPQAA